MGRSDSYASSGLVVPRPDWVFPEEIRTTDQTDNAFQQRGPNEYKRLNDFIWSPEKGLFLGTDRQTGIYEMTPEGGNVRVNGDHRFKSIAFYNTDAGKVLLGGQREDATVTVLNADTLESTDQTVNLAIPDGSDFDAEFGFLIALAQDPDTNVIYGVRDPRVDENSELRELITLDPMTGGTNLIGPLGINITSLAFVTSGNPLDLNGDGVVSVQDINSITDGNTGLRDQIITAAGSELGDFTGDGQFDSDDLIEAFSAGHYANGEAAVYTEGDMDLDGDFDSDDLIEGFAAGGYDNPNAAAVPEPATGLLATVAALWFVCRRRRR